MDELVDARNLLDANGRTQRAFRARILGRFRRTGPNAWDPYRFVAEPGGEVQVPPGSEIHLEPEGVVFRMSSGGTVLRVEWLPTLVEQVGVRDDARSTFLRTHVTVHHDRPRTASRSVFPRRPTRRP